MACWNRGTCVERETKVQLNINVLIKKTVTQYSKSSKDFFFSWHSFHFVLDVIK